MLDAASRVFSAAGIRIQVRSTEDMMGSRYAHLRLLYVGDCGLRPTPAQVELFGQLTSPPGEIAIYFVQATRPPLNGCATHPHDRLGAVVARLATRWTLAHEIGHVLGLAHVDDTARLMTRNGTSQIKGLPRLDDGEIRQLRSAAPILPC